MPIKGAAIEDTPMDITFRVMAALFLTGMALNADASAWAIARRSPQEPNPPITVKVADGITGLSGFNTAAPHAFISDKWIPNIVPAGTGDSILSPSAKASKNPEKPTVILIERRFAGEGYWHGGVASLNGERSGVDFSQMERGIFNIDVDDAGLGMGGTRWLSTDQSTILGKLLGAGSGDTYLSYDTTFDAPLYRCCFTPKYGTYTYISGIGHNYSTGKDYTNYVSRTGIIITNSMCDVVDMYVQFTPYKAKNEVEAPRNIRNLGIWVREMPNEDRSYTTNLIITGRVSKKPGNFYVFGPTNYICELPSISAHELCQGLHRITVKAIDCSRSHYKTLYYLGYIVYIDGIPVTYQMNSELRYTTISGYLYDEEPSSIGRNYTNEKMLFIGIDEGGIIDLNTFSHIGFAGSGKVGAIWFEDYESGMPEFAKDPTYFEVEVGEGVTQYVYDGVAYTTNGLFSVPRGTPSVEITGVMYESGWEAKKGTWYATGNNGKQKVDNEGNASGDIGVLDFALGDKITLTGFKVNYQVGTRYYQTLYGDTGEAGALADAFESGETLKLLSDVFPNEEQNYATIVISGILTLDLNGYTIYPCYADSIDVMSGGLTILDSSPNNRGQVKETSDTQYPDFGHPCAIFNDGNLIISSGQFGGIWNYDDTDNPTFTCTISGGQFKNYSSSPSNTFYLAEYVAAGHTYTFENRGTASSNDWWVIVSP